MTKNDYHGFRWCEVTCNRHFKLLPRSIVAKDGPNGLEPSVWATLGRPEQAVLVVLLRHTNESGYAYPSEGRLAAMAGLTRKTVRQAAKKLKERQLIEISYRVTREGRRSKAYQFKIPPGDQGINMPSIFIDGGLWCCLKPASKSLAVVFRLLSKPRPDLDPDFDDENHDYGTWLDEDPERWRDYLEQRENDFCNAEPCVLRELAGIGPRVYPDALRDLERYHFIKPDPDRPDYWRVVVCPTRTMTPAFLNAVLDGEDW